MSANILDIDQRLRALDIRTSFCVQAPAGSGKTELLTQRVLKLLACCERPEEVLAITFTRKAAAEMRHRLIQNLQKAQALDEVQLATLPEHEQHTLALAKAVLEQNQLQGWHLLENTSRLRITTIDGFNQTLSTQVSVLSRFGAQPEIADDFDALYEETVRNTLAYLETGHQIAGHIAALLAHFNNNLPGIQKLLCGLLGKRDQWLADILLIKNNPQRARSLLEANLDGLISETLAHARSLLASYESSLTPYIQFAAENLKNQGDGWLADLGIQAELPQPSVDALPQWQAIANFLLIKSADSFRKSVTVKNGFPAQSKGRDKDEKQLFRETKQGFEALCQELSDNEALLTALIHVRNLPPACFSSNQWQIINAMTTLLPFLVAQLELTFRQHGKVDHIQVSSAALDALGNDENPTDLALKLDYRIRHILVDEFQDTSWMQIRLLEKLTSGWQENDGRTLFIVGDGMQSCYGFRNANVGLFLT
ncbi:MAG: UvrD-helicase domain-containing protein, partial [Pseudohongiellaceae bacterium]